MPAFGAPHRAAFETQEVTNQAPPLADIDLFSTDRALAEPVAREGADWALSNSARRLNRLP